MDKAEQQFQQDEAYAGGALISLQWLQTENGRRFIQIPYNSQVIERWMRRHGKTWSFENLDEAFLACESQMLDKQPEPEAEPTPPPEPPKPPTPEELYGVWKDLTAAQVLKMTAQEMRLAGRDPRFDKKVNSLKITRTDLVNARKG
jgi:hypothetical protein